MKKYTKEEFLKAAERGEVSMIDAKHIISRLDDELEDAFKLITEYQEWRRGSETISMPNPTDLGLAIDVALKVMAEKLLYCKK